MRQRRAPWQGVQGGPPNRTSSATASEYTHFWASRKTLPELRGRRCRVLARGAMNSILVETDGRFPFRARRIVTAAHNVKPL